MMASSLRFLLAAALIASAAIFLEGRGRNEIFPYRLPLQSFPTQLSNWTGTDIAIQKDVLEVLGPGDFLLRVYQNPAEKQPFLDLLLAYFLRKRTGGPLHSPKPCPPGWGWLPVESSRVTLSLPGHNPFPANRYVIAKGDSRQL